MPDDRSCVCRVQHMEGFVKLKQKWYTFVLVHSETMQ